MVVAEAPPSGCQLRGPSEPEGSRPQRYPRDGRCPVPTRDAPPPLPADLVALLSDAHAAWTSFADQRNSLLSRSMRWRMTESLRATATVAFLVPIRRARRVPQAFSTDQRETRWRMIPAASYRSVRSSLSPRREMWPV